MHINKIRLVNFRCMEDLTVEFAPGVNVIIGDNGAGKTSLLNGICVALGGLFNPVYFSDPDMLRHIKEEDIRVTSTLIGDTTINTKRLFPVKIDVDLMIFQEQVLYSVVKENSLSASLMSEERLKNKMHEALSNPAIQLPLLNFQSALRGFTYTPNKSEIIRLKTPERIEGYKNAFDGVSKFSEILDWCFQMDYEEYKEGEEPGEYKNFKAIVSKFMQAITGSVEKPHIDYSAKIGQLVFYDGQSGESLNILSAGYQSVLCMIMDLARRAVLLNPALENFEKLEGIVIIDEIDMHLHPKWQWKILDALHMTFPSVQFIVATHSPMIISSAKDAKLIKMESPNEIEDGTVSAYGYNISDVIDLRQDSKPLPELAEKLKDSFEKNVNEGKFEEAERIIQKAIENFGKDSSPVREMKDFLEVNEWIAEAE